MQHSGFIKRFSSHRSLATLVLPCCLIMASCGGGSDSSSGVTFGGAKCESGATFASGTDIGYDYLYNFERQLNQNVSVIFDTAKQPEECNGLLRASDVLPWVRINFADNSSANSDQLSFELVEPGGRNAATLARYAVPDSSKQSAHGTFSYEITTSGSSDYRDITCAVTYDGSYCPRATGSQTSAQPPATHFMDFSAQGTVDCTLKHADGSANTQCHGEISAKHITLEELYYGE